MQELPSATKSISTLSTFGESSERRPAPSRRSRRCEASATVTGRRPRASSSRELSRGNVERALRLQRQPDADRRACVRRALDLDRPSVPLDDRLRDRQAEARAGDRALHRVRAAEEALEQPLLFLLRNAEAGVLDLEDSQSFFGAEADLDAAAARRELERVRYEVVEHLGEPDRVARDLRQASGLQAKVEALRVGDRGRGLDALAQPPVPRFELPGQAPHDREQRDVEN